MDKTTSNENFVFLRRVTSFIKKLSEKNCEDFNGSEKNDLLEDIEKAISDIRYARSCFENAKSPEMIEACIYEIKSAEARYSFLLRKARAVSEKNKIEI